MNPVLVLALILGSYTMIVLDISVVIAALPEIQRDIAISATALSWVQNAYTLAFGSLLLLGARAGDLLGRRRMFIVGVSLFTAASLAVGLAQSAAWLIGARALQGVGAAILAPSTLALLASSFAEGRERTLAVAYYAAVAGVAASVGLVMGGVLTDLLSWRVGFFVNLPFGIAIALAAPRWLPETERSTGAFDVAGALTSTFGMTALVYGVVRTASASWGDGITLAALAAGALLLVAFVRIESHAAQPIMPLRLFAHRERAAAYASRMLFLGAMVGFWFFTTQLLQRVLGFSPLVTGLAFLPTTLPNFAMALAVPRLTQRWGPARLLAGSLACAVVGMAWLSRAGPGASYFTAVALPMVLIGIGQGGALAPLTSAGMAGVAPQDAGAASGLVNVAHQVGGSLGLGVLIAVFAAAGGERLLAHGISSAFVAGTAMLVLATVIVFMFIVRRPPVALTLSGARANLS